jgi:hypothetical protein
VRKRGRFGIEDSPADRMSGAGKVEGMYCIGSGIGFVARFSAKGIKDMLSPKRVAHRWAVRARTRSSQPLTAASAMTSLQSINPALHLSLCVLDWLCSSAVLSDLLRFLDGETSLESSVSEPRSEPELLFAWFVIE